MLKYKIIETRFHPFLIRISKNENVTFAISKVMNKKKSSTKSKVKIFFSGILFAAGNKARIWPKFVEIPMCL